MSRGDEFLNQIYYHTSVEIVKVKVKQLGWSDSVSNAKSYKQT